MECIGCGGYAVWEGGGGGGCAGGSKSATWDAMTFASHFYMIGGNGWGEQRIRDACKWYTHALQVSKYILRYAEVIKLRLYTGDHVVDDGAVDGRLIDRPNVIQGTS